MAHTHKDELVEKFDDGQRPIGDDFKALLDSCHNSKLDTDVTITGSLEVSGTTTIVGQTWLDSTLRVGSTLSVNGATTLKDFLTVHEAVALGDTLDLTGNATFNKQLQVSNEVNFLSSLNVASGVTLGNAATTTLLRGLLEVNESATFDKNVHIKGDLRVDGNAYLSAGSGGSINVGDSDSDNLIFHADVSSDILVNTDAAFNLGSDSKKWNNIYSENLIVDQSIKGASFHINNDEVISDSLELKNISSIDSITELTVETAIDTLHNLIEAGSTGNEIVLKGSLLSKEGVSTDSDGDSSAWNSVYNSVLNTSADWDSAYILAGVNAAQIVHIHDDLTNVSSTSGEWNDTKTIVDQNQASWTDTKTTLNGLSAGWNQTKETVDQTHALWTDSRTTVSTNSAQWDLNSLEGLDDVNTTGVTNNSILRYDDSTSKWVVSTTEDTRAVGSITILDGNNSAWNNGTIVLIDNSKPINTLTFTGDRTVEHGTNTEVNNWSYTFGYSGVVTNAHAAIVLADVINLASSNTDLTITAEAVDDKVNLSQDVAGEGGNTSITGGLLDMVLVSVSNFTGGENPDAFEDLDDTPGSYAGHENEFVKVNAAQNGLEFISHDSSGWDTTKATVDNKKADWDDTRTTVKGFSALWEETVDINEVAEDVAIIMGVSGDWNAAVTDSQENEDDLANVMAVSASWDSVHTSVTDTSANWDSVYTSVSDTSGNWDSVHTSVSDTSANWDSVHTSVTDTSANWDSVHTSVTDTSANWDSVHTSVTDTSANWDSVHTSVSDTSANWDSVHTSVLDTSANWDSVHTSVLDTSANWDSVHTSVTDTSANWDSVHTSVTDTSANWDSVHTSVTDTSANWDSVHTSVTDTSANWDSVYSHITTVSGEGFATLDVEGKLLTSQIPELSITRVHTVQNPAAVELLEPTSGIQEGDVVVVVSTNDNLIAQVNDPTGVYNVGTKDYTGYAKLRMPDGLVQTVNGKQGPSAVLNPDDLDDSVTSHKFTDSNEKLDWNSTRATVLATSGDWNTSYTASVANGEDITNVAATSGNWDSVHTSVLDTSANWNSVHTTTQSNSAWWGDNTSDITNVAVASGDWDSVFTHVTDTSGNWDSVHTSVSDTSGNWDSVHSWVQSDSATNNSDYNETTYVNAAGDTITGDINIHSGDLSVDGLIEVASEIQHKDDVSTKIAFTEDVIKLEADGNEYITIDGAGPTPDAVIINNSSQVYNFQVKTDNDDYTIFTDGNTDRVGIGTSDLTHKLNISGDVLVTEDIVVNGTVTLSGDTEILVGDLITTAGVIISAGEPLHDIFSTDTEIHGDQTVHGNQIIDNDIQVGENATITGNLTACCITALDEIHTRDNGGASVTGVTLDVNIGGHVLHIVNGLVVSVTDE